MTRKPNRDFRDFLLNIWEKKRGKTFIYLMWLEWEIKVFPCLFHRERERKNSNHFSSDVVLLALHSANLNAYRERTFFPDREFNLKLPKNIELNSA
jgi:hypothetical protein